MSWLFRNDTSPASFEKALSRLSAQISTATVGLEKTRARNRRAKALWTLYTSLGYLVSALILILVIGPSNWRLPHQAGVVGAPLVIYGVRRLIAAVFDWSAARQQAHLERLQKQREDKIADLKKATKYDSTQELLQKYGGAPPKEKNDANTKKENQKKPPAQPLPPQQYQRTGLPPPPTANIPPRIAPPNVPHSPDTPSGPPRTLPPNIHQLHESPVQVDQPGFAPNAFPQPPPSTAPYDNAPHWYDRILDVLLGEDETLAKNRLALLCLNCRLVNGQAPPGVKTLEELGRWRCQSCGAWNGVEAETAKAVKQIAADANPVDESWQAVSHADEAEEEKDQPQESQSISEQENASGMDSGNDPSGVSKRVTRSAAKAETDD